VFVDASLSAPPLALHSWRFHNPSQFPSAPVRDLASGALAALASLVEQHHGKRHGRRRHDRRCGNTNDREASSDLGGIEESAANAAAHHDANCCAAGHDGGAVRWLRLGEGGARLGRRV